MNNLSFTYQSEIDSHFTPDDLTDFLNHPRSEFLKSHDISRIQPLINRFKSKKHFVHIGIGGSHLGTETLINSITYHAPITFLSNLDSDEISEKLDKIDIKDSLFYVVSKSGETLETISLFNLILTKLKKLNSDIVLSDYFVFCTDPDSGFLRNFAIDHNIQCLEIPKNIGGRFSVLTNVSYLPMAFCGVNLEHILQSQINFLENLKNNPTELLKLADAIYTNYLNGVNQTVLMPYSSKLKTLSAWFVQLWAESLGKDSKGFTPLSAFGSNDQHSQMQLFIDGPRDKFIILLEVRNSENPLTMNKQLDHKKIDLVKDSSLDSIINAQLQASFDTFKSQNIPSIKISINKKSEDTLVSLLLFFETLTSIMGVKMGINPFDQPGVEHGKKRFMEIFQSRQD